MLFLALKKVPIVKINPHQVPTTRYKILAHLEGEFSNPTPQRYLENPDAGMLTYKLL